MRRTIGLLVALVLAAVGTLLVLTYVRSAEQRIVAEEDGSEVLVVTTPVPAGTPVEELAPSLTLERVPVRLQVPGNLTELDGLAGQITAADLVPGEQLVRSRLATPDELDQRAEPSIPTGLQELSISLPVARAAGGTIEPGDVVGLMASFSLPEQPATTGAVLNKLLVTRVQVEDLPADGAAGDPAAPAVPTERTLAPTGNLLLTFAVDERQAERIVFASEYGTVWLTRQSSSTATGGGTRRTLENIYRD
jgi:pilus assembly protein CpaB